MVKPEIGHASKRPYTTVPAEAIRTDSPQVTYYNSAAWMAGFWVALFYEC